jgi:uncharacterized surface protein with fasciclin (FAS1) repeats
VINSKRVGRVAAIAAALTLPLAMGACGSTETAGPGASTAPSSSAPSMASSSPMMTPSESTGMSDQPFGAACSAVPKSGKGSFDGMSSDPVATAASNNPLLSTLVTAVKQAGLVDTLNNAENITVFAPTNDAFAQIDKATLNKVLADKKMLTAILTEHVVGQRLSPDMVAGTFDTLNPKQGVSVEGAGEDFTVNGSAKVLCGNVQTANATVYIVDKVLLPKS